MAYQKLSTSEMTNYMYNYGLNGNVVDHTWYKIFRRRVGKAEEGKEPVFGKPHLEAILILADIVYWYRPGIEKHDDGSISLHKKFAADILQRSYAQIEESLGISDRESKSAMQTLEFFGVARRVFRTIVYKGMKIPNVMYLEFDPIKLKDLMDDFLKEIAREKSKKEESKKDSKNIPLYDAQTSHPPHPNVTPPTPKRHTNTKTSSKSSTNKDNVLTLPSSAKKKEDPEIQKATKPPTRFIKQLNPDQRKLHDKIIKYIPEWGEPIKSETVCGWLLCKDSPFTLNQVKDAFEVYKQGVSDAKKRNGSIDNMGGYMRTSMNEGRVPRNVDAEFNKEHAEKTACHHKFMTTTERYVKFEYGNISDELYYDCSKTDFTNILENKINLARLY